MRYYKYAHTHTHTKIFLFTLSTEREKMYELFHVGYLQIVSNFHPRSTLAKIQWIFGWNIYFYNLILFHRLIDWALLIYVYICICAFRWTIIFHFPYWLTQNILSSNNFVLSLSGIGHQLSDRSVQERLYVFSRNIKYTSYMEKGVSFKSYFFFVFLNETTKF